METMQVLAAVICLGAQMSVLVVVVIKWIKCKTWAFGWVAAGLAAMYFVEPRLTKLVANSDGMSPWGLFWAPVVLLIAVATFHVLLAIGLWKLGATIQKSRHVKEASQHDHISEA